MNEPQGDDAAAVETRTMLVDCQALLSNDHFVYVSGDHGSGWVDKDAIFVEPKRAARLGVLLARALQQFNADILCGPATGGLIVAQWTAFALGVPAVFAEHNSPRTTSELRGKFAFHRGYDRLVAGKRVLVVFDCVLYNLTRAETSVLVHVGKDKNEQWTFVRLAQPLSGAAKQ